MSEGIDWINRKLVEVYSKDVSSNKANYRIVWSNSQIEKRYGTFDDITESGIYLRTVTEWREVPKYFMNPDSWVLEALQPNVSNPEIEMGLVYEPLYVFGVNGSVKQPIWRAVEMIVKAHKMVNRLKVSGSKSDVVEAEMKQYASEKALFKDMIQNESPYIAGALADGAAVTVPSNFTPSTEN